MTKSSDSIVLRYFMYSKCFIKFKLFPKGSTLANTTLLYSTEGYLGKF